MPIPAYYVPSVGEHVKLQTIDDYKQFATGLSRWEWFVVEEIIDSNDPRPEYARLLSPGGHFVKLVHTNGGEKQGDPIIVPCAVIEFGSCRQVIQKPIGWEPKYTIHAKNAKEYAKLKGWLDDGRGIKIWQSQDLSCAGRQSFTPGDVDGEIHWSMGAIEVVHDPDRIEIIDESIERMKIALRDINHAKTIDAACEISAEAAGAFKALVDAYLDEYRDGFKKNGITVVGTGYGVFQRTKTMFDGFGYMRYKQDDRPGEFVQAFFVKPITERERSRVTNRLLFRLPNRDEDWYVSHFTQDLKIIGFGMWIDEKGGSVIDEHEPKPRMRHALHLGDWPEGLED